jgi:hypothetical protein
MTFANSTDNSNTRNARLCCLSLQPQPTSSRSPPVAVCRPPPHSKPCLKATVMGHLSCGDQPITHMHGPDSPPTGRVSANGGAPPCMHCCRAAMAAAGARRPRLSAGGAAGHVCSSSTPHGACGQGVRRQRQQHLRCALLLTCYTRPRHECLWCWQYVRHCHVLLDCATSCCYCIHSVHTSYTLLVEVVPKCQLHPC